MREGSRSSASLRTWSMKDGRRENWPGTEATLRGERKLRSTALLSPSSQQPLGLLWGLRDYERKGRSRKVGTPAAQGIRRARGPSTLPCKG